MEFNCVAVGVKVQVEVVEVVPDAAISVSRVSPVVSSTKATLPVGVPVRPEVLVTVAVKLGGAP